MEWEEVIPKYAKYKVVMSSKNPEEIERQTISIINDILNQMPELKNKKIEEIKKTPEIWYTSIQNFRKNNRYFKTWNDLKNWQKYQELRRCLVLALNDFSCEYCGRSSDKLDLHVDHRIPSSLDGGEELTNFACACKFCNFGKGELGEEEFKKELIEVAKSLKNKFPEEF